MPSFRDLETAFDAEQSPARPSGSFTHLLQQFDEEETRRGVTTASPPASFASLEAQFDAEQSPTPVRLMPSHQVGAPPPDTRSSLERAADQQQNKTLGERAIDMLPPMLSPNLWKGAVSGVSSVVGGMGGAAEALGEGMRTVPAVTVPQPAQDIAGAALRGVGGVLRRVDDKVQSFVRPPDKLLGDITEKPELLLEPQWWLSGAGQAIGSALPYFVSGGLGAVTTVAPGAIEAATEGGAAYNEAIAAGKTPQDAAIAAAKVAGGNALLVAATNKLGYGVGKAVRPAIARRALEVVTEGAQEAGQEVIQNAAAGRDLGAGVANAAVLGGLGGVAIGTVSDRAARPAPLAQDARSAAPTPVPVPAPLAASQAAPAPRTARIEDIVAIELPAETGGRESVPLAKTSPPVPLDTTAQAIRDYLQVDDATAAQLAKAAIPRRARPFLQDVVEQATEGGYPGTAQDIEADVRRRAGELRDSMDEGRQAAAADPRDILRAVAERGGLSLDEQQLAGEMRRIAESRDREGSGAFGTIGGVAGVVRRAERGKAEAFRQAGLSVEHMVESLRQDPRFRDLDSNTLIERIEQAKRDVDAGGTVDADEQLAHYARGAGVEPGKRWWVAKEVPRNPKLTGEDADVQERAARALEGDWDGFRARYEEKFGNELNADNASELFGDYAASKDTRSTLVRAVRAPAAALVEDLYQRKLEEPTPDGKPGVVIFTGGGNGSGKSSSIEPDAKAAADIVVDSTLSDFGASQQKIDAAIDSGRFVQVSYVYRDPVMAFERGVLPRAKKTGRTVPIPTHVTTHINSLRVVQQLAEHYADNPAVGIDIFEVQEAATPRGRFELQPRSLSDLAAKAYPDPNVLRQQLKEVLAHADVSAAIRAGTDLSPRAPGAAATEHPAGFAPSGRDLRDGAGGIDAGLRTVDVSRPDTPAARGILPRVLGESRASSRPRVPVPLKSESARSTPSQSYTGKGSAPAGRSYASSPAPLKASAAPAAGGGSPTRLAFESAPTKAVAGKAPRTPISEPAVVQRLSEIFGHGEPSALERIGLKARNPLPVKAGRFREKAYGIYKVQPQVIRLKKFGDLTTFVHELGHHIDMTMLQGRARGADELMELMRLGAATSPQGANRDYRIAEGVAEYFRVRFADPAAARRAAPAFERAVATFLEEQPAIARQIQQATDVVQGYLAQDEATRGAARIDRSGIMPDDDARTIVEKFQTQWVDDLADLRRAVETLHADTPVDYRENAYVLARLARGAAGKASGFLEFGVRRDDGTFIAGGPSFAKAIEGVRDRLPEFSAYLAASRVPELKKRGIEPGMKLAEAEALIAKHQSPAFDKARDAIYAYQDAVLSYAVEGGLMSHALADKIRALNQAYVPFHRLLSSEAGRSTARKIANRVLPIKRIKGSGANIIDPLESIIRNTHAMVDAVEKNKAMRALVQHAIETPGGGQFVEAIPQPQVATRFNLNDVRKDVREALEDAGLQVETAQGAKGPVLEVEGKIVSLDELVTVFTPATMTVQGQDLITVVEAGKRRFYAVNNKPLYEAITQIGPKPASIVVSILGAPARALRAGATLTLGFIGRNPIRDTFVASVQTRYGFKPGVDTLRGLFEYLGKGEIYQQFLNSGAAGAALVSGDRKALQRELRKYGDQGGVRQRMQDVVRHPIDTLRALSEATEVATRLGEFMRAVKTEGRTAEGFARAGLAARDITMDFSRAGTSARAWNSYAAFFNAQIQGYDRAAATFKRDPVGATVRATTSITLMSIAVWALNHDDEEYRELPEWEKSSYWHIPLKAIGGSGWIRVPKPFELGAVFGTTFEAALDAISGDDPHAWKKLLFDDPDVDLAKLPAAIVKAAGGRLLTAVAPTAVMPLMEAWHNYDTFRDRNIVSPFDEKLEPQLQFNRWTSETAKVLGKHLDYSPAKIDHLIYGYGAGLARGVVGGAEGTAQRLFGENQAPASTAAQWPGVGAFARGLAGSDAESLQEFYRRRDALDSAASSSKRYELAGETADVERLKAKYPNLKAERRALNAAAEDLKDLRDQVDGVYKDARLSPEEKRDRLDRVYEQMVNRARQALGKKPLPSRFSGGKAVLPVPLARR